MHGCLLIINHLWRGYRKKRRIPEMPAPAGVLLTFFFFVLTCVVYRAENLVVASNMYQSMFAPAMLTEKAILMVSVEQVIIGIAAVFIIFFLPNTQQIMRRYRPVFDVRTIEKIPAENLLCKVAWRPTLAWFLFLLFASGMSLYTLLDANKVQEFIYFQF